MDTSTAPEAPKRRSSRLRLDLPPAVSEALDRRARRNDRFVYLEAARIIRERLISDGDLADEPEPAA
jgi:hypothetical protein